MDDIEKGFCMALRFIAKRMKTEHEVRTKLKTRYGDKETECIIEKLKNDGYIDDVSYTDCYIRDRLKFNPMGRHRIKMELVQRGIDKTIIESSQEYNKIDESKIIEDILNTKLCRFNNKNAGDLRRITGYLARRGFDFENINSVLSKYRRDF